MTSARELLSRFLPRTRLVEAASLIEIANVPVRLKLESELPTGSFKVRGAIYALSINKARRAISEVVASSTGNHGAAVAYAARLLDIRATIFLPADPNPVKRANIARQGARIVEEGSDLAQAFLLADAHARRTGALFLNDATDADIPDGAGTIADEIVEECPDVTAIYVPVGDTALIRGVAARAKALKPSVRIIGVQAARAPSYWQSWRTGVPDADRERRHDCRRAGDAHAGRGKRRPHSRPGRRHAARDRGRHGRGRRTPGHERAHRGGAVGSGQVRRRS